MKSYYQSMIDKIKTLHHQQKWNEALEAYTEYVQRHAADNSGQPLPKIFSWLIPNALYQSEKKQDAHTMLDDHIKLNGQNAYALWTKADFLKTERKYKSALEFAKQAYAQDPGQPKAMCRVADLHRHNKDYDEAEQLYLGVVQMDGEIHKKSREYAANGLGQICLEQRKYDEAIIWYQRHAEHSVEASNGLAQVYFEQGDYTKAEELFLKNSAFNQVANCGLARVKMKQGHHDEAERLLLPHVKKSQLASQILGGMYFQQGDYDKAIPVFSHFSRLYAESAEGLARTYMATKNYKAADTTIRLVEEGTTSPTLLYVGAMLSLQQDNTPKAKERAMKFMSAEGFNQTHGVFLKSLADAGLVNPEIYTYFLMSQGRAESSAKKAEPYSLVGDFCQNIIDFKPKDRAPRKRVGAKPHNRQN